MNLKKILLSLLIIVIIGSIIVLIFKDGTHKKENNGKLNIVVTSFIGYDFVRQIAGDKVNLVYLLQPGVEMHSYEPSPSNLIEIENSDLFIYIGGETESWTDRVLDTLDTTKTKVMKLMDTVDVIEEQEVDGAEPEEEEEGITSYDEHIWTSPKNSIQIVEEISKELILLDNSNENTYKENANKYILAIKNVQSEIAEIVSNKVRNRLVFGDRMPMQYFLNEFELDASSAFNGCSTETEPSPRVITYLVDKIKEEKIPVVLYIELSSGKVAQTIAEETGATSMQIQSLHNISKTDFNNGETYVSLMTRNLTVLKRCLQ